MILKCIYSNHLNYQTFFKKLKMFKIISNLGQTSHIKASLIKHLNRRFDHKMSTQSAEELNRLIEMGKKASAYQAIDENVTKDVRVMGIGSGSTIVYAVERLGNLFPFLFNYS